MIRRAEWIACTRAALGPTVSRVLGYLTVMIAASVMVVPRVALAHAHLVKSLPAAGAHVGHPPKLIQLWFSEAAEATMTRITVTGPDGTQFNVAPVRVDPNNALLLIADVGSALHAGSYTLSWRTVAKDDGHPSNGQFAFVVDSNPPAASRVIGENDSASATSVIQSSAATSDAVQQAPMALEAPQYIAARWVTFAAIICVLGAVAFRLFVIPAVTRQNDSSMPSVFADVATGRAAVLGLFASLAAIAASVCRLFAEQAVIGAGVGIAAILHTFWGKVWTAQLCFAVVASAAFAIAWRGRRGSASWILASVAAVLLGAAPAFSGHAMAATQHRNLSVLLDIVHVLAAGGWVGGLVAVLVIGVPAAVLASTTSDDRAGQSAMRLVGATVNAFSPAALIFAAFVIVSGAIAAYLRVGSFDRLFHSSYGTVLLIKICFVLLVLAAGAFNWLRMRKALSHRDAAASQISEFRRSAWAELGAAVLVIAATAVLVAAQPPVR